MEDEINIEPNEAENHATYEQKRTADLLHKVSRFTLIILLDSRCQLWWGNGCHGAIGYADHYGYIGGNGKDTCIIQSHFSGNKEGRERWCKHAGYCGNEQKPSVEQVLAH